MLLNKYIRYFKVMKINHFILSIFVLANTLESDDVSIENKVNMIIDFCESIKFNRKEGVL